MAKEKETEEVIELLDEVCNFVFEFSNVCWNSSGQRKRREAQRLGVVRLMALMPTLCREYLRGLGEDNEAVKEVLRRIDVEIAEMEKQAEEIVGTVPVKLSNCKGKDKEAML